MLETPNLVHTLEVGPYKLFLKRNLVRLELVPVLNGLTLNWTFTYSRTISALGLVFVGMAEEPNKIVLFTITVSYLVTPPKSDTK